MHSKTVKIEIMINDQNNHNRYHNNLESVKDSTFVFGYVHLLYYKCN